MGSNLGLLYNLYQRLLGPNRSNFRKQINCFRHPSFSDHFPLLTIVPSFHRRSRNQSIHLSIHLLSNFTSIVPSIFYEFENDQIDSQATNRTTTNDCESEATKKTTTQATTKTIRKSSKQEGKQAHLAEALEYNTVNEIATERTEISDIPAMARMIAEALINQGRDGKDGDLGLINDGETRRCWCSEIATESTEISGRRPTMAWLACPNE